MASTLDAIPALSPRITSALSLVKSAQKIEANIKRESLKSVDARSDFPSDEDASLPMVRAGSRGGAVERLQQRLKDVGVDPGGVDGVFGSGTRRAVVSFQRSNGLDADGVVGPQTWAKLLGTDSFSPAPTPSTPPATAAAAAAAANTVPPPPRAAGTVDATHPWLQKLATRSLANGPTGSCVATSLGNLDRMGIPSFQGGTAADPNNARGAMVQMLRNGQWTSMPLPGAQKRTIVSPYGRAEAFVLDADSYERMAQAGKIPSGAVLFQTRHGWSAQSGAKGNDMGIVRNGGRVTHNYADMSPIIYGNAKEVVLLVPKKSLR